MFFTRLACFFALLGVAAAHFQLLWPPTRGFIEDDETQEPCGGFNNVTTRTPFPLGSTYVLLASEHEQADVLVMIAFDSAPSDIRNFTQTPSGQAQPPIRNWFQIDGSAICIGVDISSIGYPSATNGTNATLAVQYNGGDGALFQCSDIVLSTSATITSNDTCTGEFSTTPVGTATAAAATTTTHGAAGQLEMGIASLMAIFGFVAYLL